MIIPFGVKINELLEEYEMTRKEAAEISGLPESVINGIANNQNVKNISLRKALSLAKLFDMDIYELIEDTEYEVED